tara:strand:+ start:2015 stop:2425 length:411 start_codon:yes stop_codon:yes gene_type:complete
MSSNDLKKIILFDGVCNLCTKSVNFIIKYDRGDHFRFTSIQSEAGKKIIKKYSIDINKNDSIILIANKNISYRSNAVFTILFYLKTIWRILLIFSVLPSPIRDLFYRIIAKSRYKFFGKNDICMTPNEDIKSKFLT